MSDAIRVSVPDTATAKTPFQIDGRVVSAAVVLFAVGSIYLGRLVHWRHGALARS